MKKPIKNIFFFIFAFTFTAHAVSLQDIVSNTVKNAKDIKLAKLGTEQAKSNLKKAQGLWIPQIKSNFFALPVYETTGDIHQYETNLNKWGIFTGAELTLTQPLFGWGLEKNYRKAAEKGLVISRADASKEQNQVIKKVVKFYYNYLLSNKLLEIIENHQEKLQQAEKAIKRKKDSRLLLKFKLRTSLLEEKISETKMAKDLTMSAILYYTGFPSLIINDELVPLLIISENFSDYFEYANNNNFDLKKLNEGLIAKQELLRAEKKKILPVFFAIGKASFKYSNVKEKQINPWRKDPYNTASAGGFLGMEMKLNYNVHRANIEKATIELNKLKIQKHYAQQELGLIIKKAYQEFRHHNEILSLKKKALKFSKKLFVKESLRYDLRKNNGKELLDALLEKVLALKNYYTAVINSNMKYIDLLSACGKDLSDVKLYDTNIIPTL